MNKNMLLLIFIICFVFFGCKEIGTSEDGQFQIIETIPLDKKITFSDLQQNVINPNGCINCHGWASDENQVLRRIKVGDPEGSSLYRRLKSGSMPPSPRSPVTTAMLEILERYINDQE